MTNAAKARQSAGISQSAAAALAGVSPQTARIFERTGAAGVPDIAIRSRLEAVYRGFRRKK